MKGSFLYDDIPERSIDPPAPTIWPRCPVCGAETDTLYRNQSMDIVGCDGCIRPVDAWEGTACG